MRRHLVAALSATVVAGCLSVPKGVPEAAPKSADPPPPADPTDPLPPGLTPKFRDFLTGQGLTSTPAQVGEAAQLTVAWNNKVIYAPDPTRGGEPVPGLIAKLWVFGPDEAVPIVPDGELIIGLWDNGPTVSGGRPKLLELWHIDRETAQKFRKKDFMGGEAYTLFLPWGKYHVDLKQVNVTVRYNGADGRCLASSPQALTLDHSATLQRAAEKLGLNQPGAPAPLPPAVAATAAR
jgi:hypothetical protein